MAATLSIPETIGGGLTGPAASRLQTLEQLAKALEVAVERWAEDEPEEIWRRQRELERLRDDLARAPEILAQSEECSAELLRALAMAARHVRQINAVYLTLLQEAQKAIGLRLRHLAAYAPVYTPGSSPEPLFWDAPVREARA